MTRKCQRLLTLYLSSMIALAALGAHNQNLYRRQWQLIGEKQDKQNQLVELRSRAASVTGPLAVRAWALEHGMVPTPEVRETIAVYPVEPPVVNLDKGGLEIRTIWR